jgi:hypothetical protein
MIPGKQAVRLLVILSAIVVLGVIAITWSGYSGMPTDPPASPENISPTATTPTPARTGSTRISTEEWHKRAEEGGHWGEGILVNETLSDEEIYSILREHGVPDLARVYIYSPSGIGYYLEAPEADYASLRDTIDASLYNWGVSFSYDLYAFVPPQEKRYDGVVLTPVFVFSNNTESKMKNYQNLLDNGIPVRKAKVVSFDLRQNFTIAERREMLDEFNADDRVLFAFKEYTCVGD